MTYDLYIMAAVVAGITAFLVARKFKDT